MDNEQLIKRLVHIKCGDEWVDREIDTLIQELNDETQIIVAPELEKDEEEEMTLASLHDLVRAQSYRLEHHSMELATIEDQIQGRHPSIADRLASVEAGTTTHMSMIVALKKRIDDMEGDGK